ncbi:hypothetical protein ACHWQZ_G009576 [Mnemiopsis leidyi]
MKITDLETEEQSTVKGHTAPILRTTFGRKFFASSSCDGTLKIWETKSKECLKTLEIYPKSNDVDLSKVRGAVQFDEQENLIAAKENEIKVYSSGLWTEKKTLKSEDMTAILELELSHCKRYLVVGCKDGTMLIWDLHTYCCVNKIKCISVPSSIATHPAEYKMLVGDLRGKWRECDPYLTSEMLSNLPENSDDADVKTSTQNGVQSLIDMEAEDFDDWGDDENQDIMNMDRDEDDIKAVASRNAAIINDDDDDSNEPSILQMAKLPERSTTPELVKDDPVQVAEPEPEYVGPELQEAFQVSSSPDHLKFRYLVWNDVGIITSREEEDSSYINIDFHDSTTHHPLHMVNSEGYTMGSLSKFAYSLATPSSDSKSKCSKVLTNVFSSWSASKEWSVNLPKEESVVLLTVSNTLLGVVSDLQYVRTWSLGGLQRHVISLPGDPVTLASHNDLISVAHYSGATLSFSLYDTKKPRLVHCSPLPLTPSSTLSWMGFTEGALPLVYDSEGVMRGLLPQGNLMWVPLSDLKVGKRNLSDTYWVVSASDDAIKCVLCKGVTYPGIAPRPILSIVPHTVPLCDSGSERSNLEQGRILNFVKTYSLNKLNTFHKECRAETMEKEEVTLLLKLMALAIKNNKDFKAFELAKMMPTKQSLEMASRYASKTGKVLLAQKINNVLRNYEEVPEEEDDIFEVTEVSYNPEPFIAVAEPSSSSHNSNGISLMSKAKKRVSQIDDTVAPLRLNNRPPPPSKPEEEDEEESQNPPSPAPVPVDVNPFSVKSDEVRNTQRRSTSFLETIEMKGLEQGQKRKSLQNIPEKSGGLTLADLGKKSSFLKVTKSDAKKLPTKKSKPKTKKKTGYALWFETQEGVDPKAGPLKWRHLSPEEKEKWLEQAKQMDNKPAEPSVSLVNSFKKNKPDDNLNASSGCNDIEASVDVPHGHNVQNDATVEMSNISVDDKEKNNEDKVTDEKENLDSNNSENLESSRAGKRKVSFETEDEDSAVKPSKAKRVSEKSSGDVSTGTKSKLAAFQFKKK